MRDHRVTRVLARSRRPDHTGHFVALILVVAVLIGAVFAGILAGTVGSPVVLPQAARLVAPVRTPTKVPATQPLRVFDTVLAPAEPSGETPAR